ncbi:protein adenylyltransferase SelO [Brackiella oedipodis]|uniref:protein adenylyltransferase SelO n=1 Tax=Brackiella oedipodis TaxID=124225 RepID=UPI00048A5A94|nr:YdiU family protein [Brackiella oedipodis]
MSLQVELGFADLPPDFYSAVKTDPLPHSQLLHVNPAVAQRLGISPECTQSDAFFKVVSGQAPLPGGKTVAAVYSGHQFGVWAGQLGDGRAHYLGAIRCPDGQLQELQLKGSGMTPYSRMGDGRAVLRSSIREYLGSIAMRGLGIATTDALCIVTSPYEVPRETLESTAIVTRVAPSFVRFGSFQHWFANSRPDLLVTLLNYICRQFYREQIAPEAFEQPQQLALAFLELVSERTAKLLAQWQLVGFVHGVMNTDNMSVLGLTLDYGPFGFMDDFQANWGCNHTDTAGRYAYHQQAEVAQWNLYQLASCFTMINTDKNAMSKILQDFAKHFSRYYYEGMRQKFGLAQITAHDQDLVNDWWRLLHENLADFTQAFYRLSGLSAAEPQTPQEQNAQNDWLALFTHQVDAKQWLDAYRRRLQDDPLSSEQRQQRMLENNPAYILRNHIAQSIIEEVQKGDTALLNKAVEVFANPFVPHQAAEFFSRLPDPEQKHIALSCSS